MSFDEQSEMRNIANIVCACYALHYNRPTAASDYSLSDYISKLQNAKFSQRFFNNIRDLEIRKSCLPNKIDEVISALIVDVSW
jgi:hypothetical protein